MAAGNEAAPIIKKVKKVSGGGHHGGAWKVAYADFVTAMMAFFLLMWLLSSTSEEQRKGIADFFSPSVPISDRSAGGRAMFNGEIVFTAESMMSDGTGGATKGDQDTDEADEDPNRQTSKPEKGLIETEDSRTLAEMARDLAAEMAAEMAQEMAREMAVDIAAEMMAEAEEQQARAIEEKTAALAEEAEKALSETNSEDGAPSNPTVEDVAELDDDVLEAAAEERREREIRAVEAAFEALKEANEGNALLEHLSIKITPDGLMIEISEIDGRPLFETGSAAPTETLRALIEVVAPIIGQLENDIALVGHTDARPYRRGSKQSNWTLSADRADAARIILLEQGLAEERIQRITGAAATQPLTDDPFAPENRRIGITLLRGTGRAAPDATEASQSPEASQAPE